MENDKGRVRFRHVRYIRKVVTDDGSIGHQIDNLGGATIAYREESPGFIRVAMAVCSVKDNFSKKVGRTISAGRLQSEKQSIVVEADWNDFIKTIPYTMGNIQIEYIKVP